MCAELLMESIITISCSASLGVALQILGGRWRLILVSALFDGPKRFSDLQKETGISRRILTVNLRALEEVGLISRTAYPEVPPRVEYGLTSEGMKLRPIINDLCVWGQKFSNRQSVTPTAPANSLPVE
jgi:DNA-binding HxlR family transcriptional regulator